MTGPSSRVFICGLITLCLLATSAPAQLLGPEHVDDNYPGPGGEGFIPTGGEPNGVAVAPSVDFPNGAWNMTTDGLQRYRSETAPILGDFTLSLRGSLSFIQDANTPGTSPEEKRTTGLAFVVDAVSGANPRYSFGWNEQLTRVIHQHDGASGIPAQFFALDATQVHTYQLIRQGSVADFYVDGNLVINNVDNRGVNFGQGLDPPHTGLFFGSISSNGNSQSDSTWDLIRLEEGVNIIGGGPPDTVFTWSASGSGEWDLPGNWTPLNGRPPDNRNETAIFGDAIGSNSRTVFTDSAKIVNSVRFDNSQGGSYAVAGSGSVNLSASDDPTLPTIQVSNGGSHQFQAIVNLQDDTTATIDSGSTLTFTNSLNLNGNTLDKMGPGTVAINNSLSTGGGTFNCNEGTCSGAGSISGNLNNNGGTVSPGNSPGVMTVEGNFAQAAAGTLLIELAGTTAGTEYDVLQVEGETSLSGILEVSLLDGFEPTVGDAFGILQLGSIAGEFDQVILPVLTGSLSWDDSALTTQGSISVVPEPATALLLSLGFLAFWRRPGRRHPARQDREPLNENSLRRSLPMRGNSPWILAGCFVAVLVVASGASAQTPILIGPEHVNDNNPIIEGFIEVGTEPPGSPVAPNADFPSGAWNMLANGIHRFKTDTAPITGDFTFTIRGLVSSNQHAANPGANPETLRATGVNFVIDAASGANPRYSFGWNEQLTRVIHQHDTAGGATAQFFELDATQVHTYQLIRESGVADFWVDGVKVIDAVDDQGFNYGQGLDAPHTGMFLGSLSSNPNSVADSTWDLWRLEAGVHPIMGGPPVTSFSWSASGAGEWDVAGNWTPSVSGRPPDSNTETAVFGDAIGSDSRTVFTDSAITVNTIQFENTLGGSYVVAGTGSINLAEDTEESITPKLMVTNQGSHEFQAIVNLQNDTTAEIEGGSTLTFTNSLNFGGNSLTKTGDGTIEINNILSTGNGVLNCLQGTCSGSGTIGGNVDNNGTVAPGNSPGILTVDGDYTQGSGGRLLIEIDGSVPGDEHDKLVVSGAANLDGTLEVLLGFTPAADDSFDILDAGSVSGNFSNFVMDSLFAFNPLDGTLCYDCGVQMFTDYDNDGTWNLGDLNLVLFNWQVDGGDLDPLDWINGAPPAGTPVGLTDLNQVLFNWQLPSSLAAVPEPATTVLLIIGLFVSIGSVRNRLNLGPEIK